VSEWVTHILEANNFVRLFNAEYRKQAVRKKSLISLELSRCGNTVFEYIMGA
jgi:hypothetical protein